MSEHEERMENFAGKFPALPPDADWRLHIDPRPCPDCGPRGQPGPQGETGETGRRGPPVAVAWAVVVLFIISFVMGTTGLYLSLKAFEHSSHHDALCTALSQLAREMPPAGNPVTNPSRAYAQQQHATFVELHSHFGCG